MRVCVCVCVCVRAYVRARAPASRKILNVEELETTVYGQSAKDGYNISNRLEKGGTEPEEALVDII